jgi:hypothetical protein
MDNALELVNILTEFKADVNISNDDGWTPLHLAGLFLKLFNLEKWNLTTYFGYFLEISLPSLLRNKAYFYNFRNKPMVLFPRKYCNKTHIQSQLYHRQKMIFHNDKLIYTQNLKFYVYLNKFTEFRSDLYSLR